MQVVAISTYLQLYDVNIGVHMQMQKVELVLQLHPTQHVAISNTCS
jgi:hypothetical protein